MLEPPPGVGPGAALNVAVGTRVPTVASKMTIGSRVKGLKLTVVVLVAAGVLVTSHPAAADNKIVLESYTGGKTDGAADQLRPLLEALANRGFVGGYEALGRTFEARVSRPAFDPRGGLPADFSAQIDNGNRAWNAGKFEEAIKILTPLVDKAHANGGAFASNQDARESLSKALIALALAHDRRGDPAASREAFGELLRSFPSLTLSPAIYGPDAVAKFDKAKRELAGRGLGRLTIRTNANGAVVFVDEKFQGTGNITRDHLIPGEYRVFVQVGGKQLSRIHRVVVRPNETATVTIDTAFDQVVQTSPTWTGLSFANAAERERSEIRHAAMFGNAVDASAVAVVGLDQVHGHAAVIGILIDRISSTEIRRASVPLDPPPGVQKLNALAEFLAGENLSPPGIDVIVSGRDHRTTGPIGTGGNDGDDTGGPRDRPSHGWGGWKYIAGGAAVVALGAGAVLLELDGSCRTDQAPGVVCPDLYNTATPGYLALGGGAVLAGVTIYLFVHSSGGGDHPSSTAFVVPARGGAVAGYTMRF